MSSKLLSAIVKGQFAISEEGARGFFPVVQSILRGTHQPKAEDLPEDEILAWDENDELEPDPDPNAEPVADSFTGKIMVMAIRGPIMHYGGECSYGAVDYAARLMQYADDETISAGLIEMDSPGGQVDGTDTWGRAVGYFAAKKPIIVFCEEGVIASAALWGASYATERYCGNIICRVGSAGVMAILMDARKAMEMEGYREVIIRAPQSVDKNKDTEDALDGKPEAYEAELKFVCDFLLDTISANLDGQLTSEDWKTGKTFFAQQATTIGLINGIKTRAQVIQRLQELALQNSQNQNTMFGKNKMKALTALSGMKAEEITAAHVDAVNDEIVAENIDGVTLALDSTLETATAAISNSSTALASINTALGEGNHKKTLPEAVAALISANAAYATKITALEKESAEWKAKAVEYGAKPADEPTAGVKAVTDEIPGTEKVDAFYSEADAQMAQLRAQTGFSKKPAAVKK